MTFPELDLRWQMRSRGGSGFIRIPITGSEADFCMCFYRRLRKDIPVCRERCCFAGQSELLHVAAEDIEVQMMNLCMDRKN